MRAHGRLTNIPSVNGRAPMPPVSCKRTSAATTRPALVRLSRLVTLTRWIAVLTGLMLVGLGVQIWLPL